MKQIILCIAYMVSCAVAFAQKDIPSFGKVDISDLQMKECSFDKAAEAVVLFDVGEVYCSYDPGSMLPRMRTEIDRHVRIKILNSKGLDKANIRIRYISINRIEEIKNFSAQTINLDASGNAVISKVDKQQVFDKKINKRYSEMAFAFPEVRPGSIIEYKYRDVIEDYVVLKDWYFQKDIPVKLSRYTLNVPVELMISAQPQGPLYVSKKDLSEGSRFIKAYSMTEVPALRDEPYITCDEDYLQKLNPYMIALDIPGQLRHNLLRTWPGIIKSLREDEDFGVQLKKNIPRTSDLDAALSKITDPYNKMALIYDYVRKNMHWDNSNGIWALEGVKAAWKDKRGTAGEINLILVNLLKDADLDASPVLLSTRENGRINTDIPGIDQFNKVMAYVTIDGKNYVLDATNKYSPVQLIPLDVLYSDGLVISKANSDQWGWKLVADPDHYFENSTSVEASIDAKGVISGNVQVMSKDYSRMIRARNLVEGKEKFTEKYLTSSNDNSIKISDLKFQNEETDSLPLIQEFKFTSNASSSGDYNYFSANLFSGLEKNPFIADTRTSDIFFGARQMYMIVGSFTIPEGYAFDELPKNTRMRLPDTSIVFTRYVAVEDRTVSTRMVLEFKKPFYAGQEYPGFHEFYKKLFAVLNEQFVYKKK